MTVAIPVVLDTDIGLDVDDVWALAFLLRCPELDIRLITTCTGDTRYRAALVARLLEIAGRSDIPIGIGIPLDDSPRTHAAWLDGYRLEDYAGPVLADGVGALCDAVMASAEAAKVIAIGPLPNLAAALQRCPEIVTRSSLVGMHGSLRRGYLGAPKPMREYNVKQHALACQHVLGSGWDATLTPLDSCGTAILRGARFRRLLEGKDPLLRAVLENHFSWFEAVGTAPVFKDMDPHAQSSVLYDTVTVYAAFAHAFLEMETLPVRVTDDGKTLIDDDGVALRCATGWRNQEAFFDLLVERLLDV